MDIRKLQRAIVDGLEDVKAQQIVVFNTEHLSPLFERVIIASGTSNRQTRALASSVRESVKKARLPVLSVEGEGNGEWIIVDCGAAVAHIMQPAIRDYYRLEEIWGGKPVRMKLAGDAPAALPKASAEDRTRAEARPKTQPAGPRAATALAGPPAKKAAASARTADRRPGRTTVESGRVSGVGPRPAGKTATRKAAPRKSAARKPGGR